MMKPNSRKRLLFDSDEKSVNLTAASLEKDVVLSLTLKEPDLLLKIESIDTVQFGRCYRLSVDALEYENRDGEITIWFFGDSNSYSNDENFTPLTCLCGSSSEFPCVAKKVGFRKLLIPRGALYGWKNVVLRITRKWTPVDGAEKKWARNHTYAPTSALFPREPFDATLQGKYPVHRDVLIARSPVFAAAFSNAMRESQTGDIKLFDNNAEISDDVARAFVAFLYDPSVEFDNREEIDETVVAITNAAKTKLQNSGNRNDDETETVLPKVQYNVVGFAEEREASLMDAIDVPLSLKLLEIAHRFQVHKIVEKIELKMLLTLSCENLLDFYVAARLYKLTRLLQSCAAFSCHMLTRAVEKQNTAAKRVESGTESDGDFHEQMFLIVALQNPHTAQQNKSDAKTTSSLAANAPPSLTTAENSNN